MNNKSEEKEEKKSGGKGEFEEINDEKEEDKKEEKEQDKKEFEEKEEIKEEKKEEEKQEEKEKEKVNLEEKEEEEEVKEQEIDKKSENRIVEMIDEIFQEVKKGVIGKEKENEIPKYNALFYTESLDKLSLLYNDYISKNINIYTINTPNKPKDFLIGIYPKIIIAKKENDNEDKIYGICGINFDIDENKEYILKINHISVYDNNKDILNQFIELIEKEIKYKIIEIEIIKDNREKNNILIEILKLKNLMNIRIVMIKLL